MIYGVDLFIHRLAVYLHQQTIEQTFILPEILQHSGNPFLVPFFYIMEINFKCIGRFILYFFIELSRVHDRMSMDRYLHCLFICHMCKFRLIRNPGALTIILCPAMTQYQTVILRIGKIDLKRLIAFLFPMFKCLCRIMIGCTIHTAKCMCHQFFREYLISTVSADSMFILPLCNQIDLIIRSFIQRFYRCCDRYQLLANRAVIKGIVPVMIRSIPYPAFFCTLSGIITDALQIGIGKYCFNSQIPTISI